MPIDIDWKFIAAREGASKLVGYVPLAKKSQSGVTIATGFDIGQRNRADLVRLGLPEALVEKLAPYCRLKREEALAFLRKRPLKVTRAQSDLIDRAVKRASTETLAARYDADSTIPFADIPREAQTVIASVEFQYGSIRDKKGAFWRLVTTQQWKAAETKLRNFGDKYKTRRRLEADYLQQLVKRLEAEEKAKQKPVATPGVS